MEDAAPLGTLLVSHEAAGPTWYQTLLVNTAFLHMADGGAWQFSGIADSCETTVQIGESGERLT